MSESQKPTETLNDLFGNNAQKVMIDPAVINFDEQLKNALVSVSLSFLFYNPNYISAMEKLGRGQPRSELLPLETTALNDTEDQLNNSPKYISVLNHLVGTPVKPPIFRTGVMWIEWICFGRVS